ncbi:MAG: hypothetical protein LBS01_01085 [Prevotellaceae bacterium]|jgi:hypothetical protein|nr:hypothetical protein [Prevotellaceae bacterium]
MNIKRFDPVIYPQKLWVAISKDGKDMNGLFRHKKTDDIIRFEEYDFANFEAVVFPVSEVKSDYHGALIIFAKKKYMTCKTIAHEAVHAAGYMFKHIEQEIDSDEPFAFLTGWIADCCFKVKTK